MDKLTTGLQITVIGMAIVFIILILLNVAMNAMNVILNRKQEQTKPGPRVKPAPASPEPKAEKAEPEQENENPELIALLTAAVMAVEGRTEPVRIRALRLVSAQGAAWKHAGRTESMQ